MEGKSRYMDDGASSPIDCCIAIWGDVIFSVEEDLFDES